MKIIYGTGNQEKLNQVKGFIRTMGYNYKLIGQKEIGFYQEIEENGSTFEENSLIKALAIKEFCKEKNINDIIVTDDTGLCVDALDGAPGVHTARYAGDHAPQEVAINKLLENMKNVKKEDRTAKFICVLTVIMPNGEKLVFKGETKGKIATEPGTMGKLTFGPIFIPDGFDCVMNDLTDKQLGKTHREKAFMELFQTIESIK